MRSAISKQKEGKETLTVIWHRPWLSHLFCFGTDHVPVTFTRKSSRNWHIHGYPVGIIANNGILFLPLALKATLFMQLCSQRQILQRGVRGAEALSASLTLRVLELSALHGLSMTTGILGSKYVADTTTDKRILGWSRQ